MNTIHGIITLNTILFIPKVRNFFFFTSHTIVATCHYHYKTCAKWRECYDNKLRNYTVIRLYTQAPTEILSSNLEKNLSNTSYITISNKGVGGGGM